MDRTPEQQAIAGQMYDKLRDALLQRDLSNSENYDRAIFTVSTTFLGVSIAVIKFVVPIEYATYMPLLILSWFALFLAIASSIWSYRVGNKAIKIALIKSRQYYIEGDETAFDTRNKYEIGNNRLNIFAGAAVIVAMLLLVTFISINITKEAPDMTEDTSIPTTPIIKESSNIPKMEKVPTIGDIATNSANIPTMEQVPIPAPTTKPTTDKE